MLSRVWPGHTHTTSALRILIESPGVMCIAYFAARFRRNAAFLLGGMMLCVAVLLSTLSGEVTSAAYTVVFLTVGPLAAVIGGMLRRARITTSMTRQ
jgi:hypothetical protein